MVTRTHDSGLALINDGVPDLVLEEERFNREKHTRKFPFHSLRKAFDERGLDLSSIDVVTAPWHMRSLRRSMFDALAAKFPATLNLVPPSARPTQSTLVVSMPMGLRWGLWWHFGPRKLPPIVQVKHHDAHAAMFFVSPFEEAAVLVMDGYGDETAQSAYAGVDNRVERLWHSDFFDSLGMLYTATTQHLGFKLFQEGTVMALAATGGPTYTNRFGELLCLEEDGRFRINRDYISYDTHGLNRPFKQRFIDAFGPPRGDDEPIEERHRDLAFALQSTIEDAVVHMARAVQKRLRSRHLCLIGGVALNCVANARVLQDTDFETVWVPPCASDSGAPLGSALWHYHQTLGHARGFELTHAFHGLGYSDEALAGALRRAGLAHRRLDDGALFKQAAADIAAGRIVGWFQGRSEIGPRALGNRSILADPRNEDMKDRINTRVKHREPFRPFAPAVLRERASEFFHLEQADPFMTLAPRVRAAKAALIPACVHVDGTARIQTVARDTNPRFHRIIETFGKLTGIPLLLNTSFNLREPIVESPDDAISCFMRTQIDALAIGNFYVTDRSIS